MKPTTASTLHQSQSTGRCLDNATDSSNHVSPECLGKSSRSQGMNKRARPFTPPNLLSPTTADLPSIFISAKSEESELGSHPVTSTTNPQESLQTTSEVQLSTALDLLIPRR
ncbi:hypothetical protein GJ744_010544 [Endocarpon pusillum]|uniref:Uncharacterized protein n=1 Tax=Endocarpon pusillum TaxID=364733 RepID=A0A8H7E9F8_9EURO|nr:hypothetical protein GJ744_010544 [Endocarpon pusillum]